MRNDRRWFITPQSVESAIAEEKAKAAKVEKIHSEPEATIPPHSETENGKTRLRSKPEPDSAQVGSMEKELTDLSILNRGNDSDILTSGESRCPQSRKIPAQGGAGIAGFRAVQFGAKMLDERVVCGVGLAVQFDAQFGAGGVGPQVDRGGKERAHEAAGVVVAAHFLPQDGHQGAFGPVSDEFDSVEELFPSGPQLRHALFGREVFQLRCAREDLNLHPLRDQILSLACLPFHHSRVRNLRLLLRLSHLPLGI